jgi:DNA polymerase III alpha subunit
MDLGLNSKGHLQMQMYEMECGCAFPIIGTPPFPNSNIPAIEIDWDNIPLDCKETWELISTGKTRMCFQIEKGGGKIGARELKPENIEHIAGLGAALRPGCSKVYDKDGITTTKHYYRRKNGEEPVPSYHPIVDEVLASTYNLMLYQEQAMKLAELLAGLNKQQADSLRRAMGKKKADEMSKVKTLFVEGAKKIGVISETQAEEIFGWIRESQRYSFNRSVTLDTIVETEDGITTIKDLQIGQKIKSPNGFIKVRNKFDHGKQDVFQIILESGRQIKCTMEHKFLSENNKIIPLSEIILKWGTILCDNEKFEKVTTIKNLGQLPTYDIEVDSKDHIYYGNGIANSNSHAIGYGIIGYQCGFAKQHFAPQAFCSWLREAKNKAKPLEEIAELVADAKLFGFHVRPPEFFDLKVNFQTDGDKVLTAGISNIKGIGENQVTKIKDEMADVAATYKPIQDMNWYEFLILCASRINKTAMEGIIQVGGLRRFGELRSKLLKEYEVLRELRATELDKIVKDYTRWENLADAIESLALAKQEKGLAAQAKAEEEKTKPKKKKKRKIDQEDFWPTTNEELKEAFEEIKEEGLENLEKKERKPGKADIERSIVLFDLANILRNPIVPYRDNPAEIAVNEQRLLGASLTCSLADAKPGERWTMTCKDLIDNPSTSSIIILKAKIDEVKPYVIKKGKNLGREMAFLKMSDGTCSVEDITCFADQWEGQKDEESGEFVTQGFKNVLQVGRVLEIHLERGYTKKGQKPNNSLHVVDVWVI